MVFCSSPLPAKTSYKLPKICCWVKGGRALLLHDVRGQSGRPVAFNVKPLAQAALQVLRIVVRYAVRD